MIKVSIIIPVYNVELYIDKCLLSVYQQTYKNIEIIVIDDCGLDNSIQIAKKISEPYQAFYDIIFLKHDKNRGLSAARNTGIDAANGDYIYFLDSDDYITDGCIAMLVNCIKDHHGTDMIVSNLISTRNGALSTRKEYFKSKYIRSYYDDRFLIKSLLCDVNIIPVVAWNKLIKLKFVKDHKLYFKEDIYFEDLHWNYYLAKHIRTMCICTQITYICLIRQDSIMQLYQKGEIDYLSKLSIIESFIEDIDSVCLNAQKQLIFNCILFDFTFTDIIEFEKALQYLLIKFSKVCNPLEQFAIFVLIKLPKNILRNIIVYNLFNKRLFNAL